MKLNTLTLRGAAAIAFAGLIGIASAGEAGRNTTEIKLLGKDQKLESLKFEGELPIGESRGLYTDAGTPVTVQRTEKGLRIETPERTVEVPYGDAASWPGEHGEHHALASGDSHKRVFVMHADKDHAAHHGKAHADAHQKRVIVLKDGEVADVDVDVDLKLEDLGELAELGALDIDAGTGDKHVVVIRKVDRQAAESAE